jgi:hypothetical protein
MMMIKIKPHTLYSQGGGYIMMKKKDMKPGGIRWKKIIQVLRST